MNTLRKLQLIQLYMLKDIDRICSENGIVYYICGGTLLGAVRHKGFIPWDDDVDITMYRDDLKRFERVIGEKYSDKYFIQNFQTDKNYTRYITKLRLNGTCQAEAGIVDDDIHQGVYIDIFPLDKVTKSDGLGLRFRGGLLRYLFAYKTARHASNKITTRAKRIVIKLIKPFTRLIPSKAVNRMFDWVCTATSAETAGYTTSFASRYLWKRQLVANEVYGDGVLVPFEDGLFRAPAGYDILLRQLYRDYMALPPEDKRNSGHELVKIHLGKYEDIIQSMEKGSGYGR